MAHAKKSSFHKNTSLKGESPARQGNCAIDHKQFAHHNQRHHQKDPRLTTSAVKGSELACRREISTPSPTIKDANLVSVAVVNIDGMLSVLPPNVIPNSQGIQMTPIPVCFAYSNFQNTSMKHPNSRSKRSKSGKIIPRDCVQDNFQQNNSSILMQNDSTQDISEVVDDGDTRSNKTVKRPHRKKGKKKGKHSRVPSQHDVSKYNESELEGCLHGMRAVQTTPNNVSCSTDVSENVSSHTSISSCLSVEILNDKPEGEEYSYKQIEYIGSPSPMATSNSDEMTELEPTTSFPEDFICDDYRYTLEGCMKHSSNQACSPNTEQTDMVPSTATKNSGAFSNHSSSCDDTSCSFYSGHDTIPVSDLSEEWGSDMSVSHHASSTNPHLKDGRISPADTHVDFRYPRISNLLLDTETPISENSDGNDKSSVCCDRIGYASVSEACSVSKACTTVSQRFIPGKRARHGRKSASSCSSSWSANPANISKVGKDGGHSVWQRVEKKDVEGCIPSRNVKASSLGSDLQENPVCMKNKPFLVSHLNENDNACNLSENSSHSTGLSLSCDFGNIADFHHKPGSANLLNNLPRRVKKHSSSSVKQDSSQYSRKVSHFGKQNTVKHAVVVAHQNEDMGRPSGLGGENIELSGTFLYKNENAKPDPSLIEDIDAQSRNEEFESTKVSATTLRLSYTICNATTAQVGRDRFNTSAREVDSWQQQYRQNMQPGGNYISYKEDDSGFYQHYQYESIPDMRIDTRSCHLETSRHDYNSGVIMQKWVPVGKKGSSTPNRDSLDNPFVTHKDSHLEKDEFNNMHIPNQGFDSDSSFSNATSVSKCLSSSYSVAARFANNDDNDEGNLSIVTLSPSHKLNDENNNTMNCNAKLGAEEVDKFKVETDMQKIVQALANVCRFQNATELFNLQVGSPVAEFERVLYSASPVISQMHYVSLCKSCCSDQPVGSPLCPHQIPNISLQSVWQWYEKPGSYGLEVKVDDQHTKTCIAKQTKFRAYFVPYLSAIQLFGINSHKLNSSCKEDKLTSATMPNVLTVFSLLLPQPGKNLCELSRDPPSLLEEDDISDALLNKIKDDGELLFEYFESDPPQQRCPLFEKLSGPKAGYSVKRS